MLVRAACGDVFGKEVRVVVVETVRATARRVDEPFRVASTVASNTLREPSRLMSRPSSSRS